MVQCTSTISDIVWYFNNQNTLKNSIITFHPFFCNRRLFLFKFQKFVLSQFSKFLFRKKPLNLFFINFQNFKIFCNLNNVVFLTFVLCYHFIVFYVVIGTLSHAKIILELLLQNDKAQAFSEGGDPPLNPLPPEGETPPAPPPPLIKNKRGRIKKLLSKKNIFF